VFVQVLTIAESDALPAEKSSYLLDLSPRIDFDAGGRRLPDGEQNA